ncbi:MAG: MFS transporter [Acidimicrobiales bacterium]|nr:MFS transporter [Acidimicrobiales bacterium]
MRREVSPRPFFVLSAAVASAVLVVANISSLNVALPELSRELGATQSDVQWMIDIYAFFLATLLLPAGALGDRYGRRRMLLIGIFILGAANAATLFTTDVSLVITSRAVSGVGAALIFPATLSTITTTLPEDKRVKGVAIWTASVFFGGLSGVLISGALMENYWWGSVFLAMSILSGAIFLLCWAYLPDSSNPDEANMDPLGTLLSFVAVGGIVFGVMEGPTKGWSSTLIATSFIIGTLALLTFVLWERYTPRPLLDVRMFADRGVRSGSFSLLVQFTVAFGFFFLTVPLLAFVYGFGPLDMGLSLMPAAIGLFPASAIAIPLTRKIGFRTVGTLGLVLLAGAFYLGTSLEIDSSFASFAVVMVVYGAGIGFASPPATEIIVEALPMEKQGVASALNDVLRELGAVVGIALSGSIFNAGYRSSLAGVVGLPQEVIDGVRETPAAAALIAPTLGEDGVILLDTVAQSVIDGWGNGLWAACITATIGAIGFCFWAPGRDRSQVSPSSGSAKEGSVSYSDVSKVLMIEGTRTRTSITVSHKVVTKNKHNDG